MTKEDFKPSRAVYVQLSQALEQYKTLTGQEAEKMLRDSYHKDRDEVSAWELLQTKKENRRSIRMQQRLPVLYSESAGVRTQKDSGASREQRELELSDWIQELAGARDQMLNTSSGMKMIVHLQALQGELIYFIAFMARRAGQGPFAASSRKVVISGSGMNIPSERSHRLGEMIFVVLFLPTEPFSPLRLVAKVVRSSVRDPQEGFRTPVKFVNISQEDQDRIVRFISRRQRQSNLSKVYKIDT